eukprot:1190324-Prorocentrum_minimum.AAC.3
MSKRRSLLFGFLPGGVCSCATCAPRARGADWRSASRSWPQPPAPSPPPPPARSALAPSTPRGRRGRSRPPRPIRRRQVSAPRGTPRARRGGPCRAPRSRTWYQSDVGSVGIFARWTNRT